MKDSTRHKDRAIVELIATGKFTAKEIAMCLFADGIVVTVDQVYHAAYRNSMTFRSGIDRRGEQRTAADRRRDR